MESAHGLAPRRHQVDFAVQGAEHSLDQYAIEFVVFREQHAMNFA